MNVLSYTNTIWENRHTHMILQTIEVQCKFDYYVLISLYSSLVLYCECVPI